MLQINLSIVLFTEYVKFWLLFLPQVEPKDPQATHFVPCCFAKRHEDVIRFIKTNSTEAAHNCNISESDSSFFSEIELHRHK